jgi:TBC1 domain family member 6
MAGQGGAGAGGQGSLIKKMAVDLGSLNREKTSTWSRPRENAAEIAVPPQDARLNSPRDRGDETHDPAEVLGRAQVAPGGHFEHFEAFQKTHAMADPQPHARSDPDQDGPGLLPVPGDHHTQQIPSRKDLRLDSVLPPLPHLTHQQPGLQQRQRQGSLPASVSQYSPLHHQHHRQHQPHLEHRPSHSQPQSLPALSPQQDQFTLSPHNPLPHPHPHPNPHQHWVPASPRQRRVLPHTGPHFISHDPKYTATPAQSQPDQSFSSFSPAAQLPLLQTRQPPDFHAPFTPIRGHPIYGRVEPDDSPCSRDAPEAPCTASHQPEQRPANLVTTRRQRSLPNTPVTPNSPGYPGPRWDSLPVRRQNSLGQYTSTGLAKTAHTPIAPDCGIPPSPIRSPQSATFPASLYSHPQIPEDQALELTLDLPETTRHEHAAAVTPVSPTKMYRPDSRQSGETAYSVASESYNFSRPRKPSLGSLNRPEFSAPLYLRPGTANTSNSDSARLESRTMASKYIPYSAGQRPVRQPSVASNMSVGTFASAAPSLYNQPSYDRLGAAPRKLSQNSATGNYMGLPHAVRPPSPPRNGLGPWTQIPYLDEDEMRSSMRSQLTTSTGQDTLFTETERSSVQTKTSSIFSAGNRNRNSPFFGPHSPSIEIRESLSVDDVMGMYAQGFNDSDMEVFRRKSSVDPDVPVVRLAPGGMDDDESRPGSAVSHNSEAASRLMEAMNQPSSVAVPGRSFPLNGDGAVHLRDTNAFFRKSLASSLPKDMRLSYINAEQKETGIVDFGKQDDDEEKFEADSVRHSRHDSGKEVGPHDEYASIDALEKAETTLQTADSTPTLPDKETLLPLSPTSTEVKIDIMPAPPQPVQGALQPEDLDPDANDRYGFRKSNQYVTRQQYDDWNGPYSQYLARRRKKWEAFLKENGLMTDHPNRFPQHSAKAKRFIRKGIPPEWRGAAWFYYAGGPKILANNRGVYDNLVKKAQNGELKDVCRDDIERDLYRTFPDNVRFRRSAPSTGLTPGQASQSPSPGNTPVHSRNNSTQSANPTPKAPGSEPVIIESLRRVLSAFAIFNPSIGYCQSLNFLGGMLLLFVESEEQAFWLLNIITRVYLPGTHEMNLEGSKVDLSVLMNELEAVLPNVWSKISDDGSGPTKKKSSRRARYHRHAVSASGDNLPPVTLALTAWFMSCFIGTLPIETTLRVWDVFFYEGSKTLFRVALAIFKAGENEIKAISDPMEVFAVVQSLPRKMVDANEFMDICFKKRSGLNHLTSDAIDQQRTERKEKLQIQRKEAVAAAAAAPGIATAATIAVSSTRNADMLSITSGDSSSMRRKHTLFGRRYKERGLEV